MKDGIKCIQYYFIICLKKKSVYVCVYTYIQMNLEQHRFELHGSTYIQIFSNKHTVRPRIPRFCIHGWESVDVEGLLDALFYTIFM